MPATTFQGSSLDALIAAALAAKRAIGVPDPDVDRFQVTVEAAIPDHDTGTPGTLPGDLDGTKWRIVYSVIETFPAADQRDGDALAHLSERARHRRDDAAGRQRDASCRSRPRATSASGCCR